MIFDADFLEEQLIEREGKPVLKSVRKSRSPARIVRVSDYQAPKRVFTASDRFDSFGQRRNQYP